MRFTVADILQRLFVNSLNNRHTLLNHDDGKIIRTYIDITTKFEDPDYLTRHLAHIRDFYCIDYSPVDEYINIVRGFKLVEKVTEVNVKYSSAQGQSATMIQETVNTILGELTVRMSRSTI
mmetsp:Transcript_11234/g.22106  ORF Transcript_11234/g.22106 Transcript_11234/m.22106 type:complete len:121 (-) Transcript_11234:38-400(-)